MIDKIVYQFPEEEFLKVDGFDAAVIGVDTFSMRLIYSVDKCLEILKEEGLTELEAREHFDYNVFDAYVGEKTPIWCVDDI